MKIEYDPKYKMFMASTLAKKFGISVSDARRLKAGESVSTSDKPKAKAKKVEATNG